MPHMDLPDAQRIAVDFFTHRKEHGNDWDVRAPSEEEFAASTEEGQALIFEFKPPASHTRQRSWPPLRLAVDPTTDRADMLH